MSKLERYILSAYEADDLPDGTIPEETLWEFKQGYALFSYDAMENHRTEVNQYVSQYDPSQFMQDYIHTRQGLGGFPLITGSNAKDVFQELICKLPPVEVPQELTDRIS